jgi:A/G-specific adenine glycosylase
VNSRPTDSSNGQLSLLANDGEATNHDSRVTNHGAASTNHGAPLTNHGAAFASRIIAWQRTHGRHDLPWQNTRDPYRIWLSEIMLQQTQVAAVIPYYTRFLERFPDLRALAQAAEDDVLAYWSGLGYYARGRNLHRAARAIHERHGGVFPRDFEQVLALPGIGRSTAAAICVFANGTRHAILDGNVKRVLARHQGIPGYPGNKAVQDRLWERADALLPAERVDVYTQGLMDLGATVCTRQARCRQCPVASDCVAHIEGRVAELPAPRPAKTLPQRETHFVIMRDGNDVLLEKRPAPGIWGGMWCFPESERGQIEITAARFASKAGSTTALAPIEHGFTHFRLRIHPMLIRAQRRALALGEDTAAWISLEAAMRQAIPAPVRILLELLLAASTAPLPQ